MLSEAKHLWSNPLGDSRIDPRFFDFAQNDTEIWLLVQFWTTVGVQRTSKFECTLARVLKVAIVLVGLSLALTACREHAAVARVDPNGPVEVVIPDHGVYTGAFMDFGDAEDDVTLETIEDFEEMVGKHQAIIVSSSYWGEQNFPTDNLNVIWRHGSLPLVFWSPWDKPYEEDHGPDKFGLTEILAGKWDAYIDKWADAARDFGHPIIVVFGVEMNGTWFPWSGAYYGGAQWVPEYNNWKGPETFRRAYRYVVDRVRARARVKH